MRLPSTGSWRIVAVHMATLAALVLGILSLRAKHAQSKDGRVEEYRSIAARLVDKRQLPQRRITRGRDGTWQLPPVKPKPPADDRVTTLVLTGQTGVAIQKLRRQAKGGNPEALTNLAAALLNAPSCRSESIGLARGFHHARGARRHPEADRTIRNAGRCTLKPRSGAGTAWIHA